MNRTLLSMALLALALPLSPVRAADAAKAKELMWLSNMHEFVAGTIKRGMRVKQKETGLTDAQLECVDAISPARFADVLTAEIAAQMSDAEVAAAIEFYRSPSAQKLVDYTAARFKDESVDNPYSAADTENLSKFMASPAGTRLFATPGSDRVTQRMSDVVSDALGNCGKSKVP